MTDFAAAAHIERGLFRRLPELLVEQAPAPLYAVVSDATVAGLYGAALADTLRTNSLAAELFTFPAGETSKTPERWAEMVESFGAAGLGRDGCVVAVGGGVTGDLAGFAAATFARGVRLVQVPTSLLAMVDAAHGGKTGVDLRAGKNLVGSFHRPVLVAVDPELLNTLPEPELRAGLAEAVKHGAIADAGYLKALHASAEAILALDPESIDLVVRGSIRIKAAVVKRDARESGERAILNFGHTIGHGIEQVTDYRIPHGQAVAVGMVAEARIGERVGVTEAGTSAALADVLAAFDLPTTLPAGVDVDGVVAATRGDKKARGGAARYALIEAAGRPARQADGSWTRPVADPDVRAVLADPGHVSAGRRDV